MKGIIKYQYAENSSGNLININAITKNARYCDKYFCLDCKQELIPRLGDKRIHHFCHKNDTHSCSKETYLHELGKKIFYETYLNCLKEKLPFYIYTSLFNAPSILCKYYGIFKSKNCKKNDENKLDLTSLYNKIEIETNQERFRPDLTLLNDYDDKIFVEIAVTHPCDKEKIESKNKIVEIKIKNEEDIQKILDKNLIEDNEYVKIYNFENFNIFVEPFCNDNALSDYAIVLKNGEQRNVRATKLGLCQLTQENISIIESIAPFRTPTTIPIVPNYNRNVVRRGTRADETDAKLMKLLQIDTKANRISYRSNKKSSGFKRRKK